MHRTFRAIRALRPLGLFCLSALLLTAGLLSAGAQEQLPPPNAAEPTTRIETIGLNQTRRIGMTTKAPIIELQNENPTVVKIDRVDKDPSTVFVTGINQGVSRLIFTDVNKKTEVVLVKVDDTEKRRIELLDLIHKVAPTASVTPTFAPNNTVILTGFVSDVETGQRIMEAARAVLTVRIGTGQQRLNANVFNGMTVGGVQQVQLEVVVAVVNRSRLRTMNFNFAYADAHTIFNSVLNSNGPTSFTNALTTAVTGATATALGGGVNNTGNLTTSPNLSFAYLGNTGAFQSYLQALNTDGLAKIMADTRVTTLSGRPALFNSGGEVPILTSGGVGQSSVSYKPFGTVVNFLPIVQNGKIHLEVRAELSSINAANGITITGVTPTVLPGFSSRFTQSAVQLEDGQTLAIGGLIQNTINASIQRVPVLGELPFLSTFFSNKSYNEVEEEMVILVTPRLVDGFGCDKFPKYLPGRETRSPDDFELFLEGILEAPRGPRYVSGDPRDYRGAFKNSPTMGTFPCAPTDPLFNGRFAGPGCANCVPGGVGAGGSPAPLTLAAPLTPPPVRSQPAAAPTSLPSTPAAGPAGTTGTVELPGTPLPTPAPSAVPPTTGLSTPVPAGEPSER